MELLRKFLNPIFVLCIIIFSGIVFKSFLMNDPALIAPQDGDKQVISIIYGVVSGFIAVMIPLHYTISFDIIGKINNANGKDDAASETLLHYCHIAEGLIFAFGLFGASVLYEEAFVIASLLQISVSANFSYYGVLIYGLALVVGLAFNLNYRSTWCTNKSITDGHKTIYRLIHYSTIILSASTGGIWIGTLLTSDCGQLNGVMVLIILTIYYFWWVIFRAVFAPMTSVKKMLIGDSQKLVGK